MGKILLSIVVPCYNEGRNIPLVLERFYETLKDEGLLSNVELILVDNNSKDDSAEVLKNELKKFKYGFAKTVFQEISGYGSAIKKGLSDSIGEFVCWTHGDIQTPPKDTIKAYKLMLKQDNPKKTFVKGTRYGRPVLDKVLTMGMSFVETILFRKTFWDINSQPNLFHRDFLKILFVDNAPNDFSFDLYAYYLVKKNNYFVKRFDVHFGKRLFGESSWNTGLLARYGFIKRTLKFSFELKKGLK